MNLRKMTLLLDIAALISLIMYALVDDDIADWACIIIFFLALSCEVVYKISRKK